MADTHSPQSYSGIRWSNLIPVFGLIGALMVQTATIAWMMSQMNAGINDNRSHIGRVESRQSAMIQQLSHRVDDNQKTSGEQAVQLGRIDENVKAVRQGVEEIKRQLEGGRK